MSGSHMPHHYECDAGEHEGLCSATNPSTGETQVFGVTTDPGIEYEDTYVSRGTAGTWDGRKETAEDPYSPHAEIERLQAEREGRSS